MMSKQRPKQGDFSATVYTWIKDGELLSIHTHT